MQSSRGKLQQMHLKCFNIFWRKYVLLAILSDEMNETSMIEKRNSHCSVLLLRKYHTHLVMEMGIPGDVHSFSNGDVVPAPNLKRAVIVGKLGF